MAKTIMIANDVYEKLKTLKKDRSFSELIREKIISNEIKKGSGLRECLGTLKKDKEWEDTKKDLKKGWKNWTKKYV